MAVQKGAPQGRDVQQRSRRLTEASIERLSSPASGRLQIADAVVTGLWLRVSATGAKSWSVVYRPQRVNTTRRITIGRWPAVGTKDARDLARAILLDVARGKDPAIERKRAEAGEDDRVENVVAEFVKRKIRPRQANAWQSTETLIEQRLVTPWRGRRIGDITRADVHRVLDRELDAGRDRTANKVLAVTRRMFGFAIERGYRDVDPTAGISRPGVEQSRERVLDDAELAAIWNVAGGLGWPWGAFTQVLALTAQRRSEVAGMRWSELDFERAVWHLSAERTKAGRAHAVPLSEPVVEILRDAPRIDSEDHVFWSSRRSGLSGFSQVKRRLDDTSGVAGWRFHDIRRTAATGMAELGVEPHVISAVLNHAPGAIMGVTAIYNRFKYETEKRRALDLWAAHLLALVEGRPGKVVALRPA